MLNYTLRGQIFFILFFVKSITRHKRWLNYNTKSCTSFITHLFCPTLYTAITKKLDTVLSETEERKLFGKGKGFLEQEGH